MAERDAIAVVGMACIFPGAPDTERFWHNLSHAIDAVGDVPQGRLDPAFYAPGIARIDRHACARGGFIDEHAYFDPYAHGMMPNAVDVAEPEQLLSLEVAARALRDAGYEPGRNPAPEKSAVVLGRGNYTSRAVTRFEQRVRGAEQVVSVLRDLLPRLAESELERVRLAFQSRAVAAEREAVINLVPNLAASRIAERFAFHGPAYTLDAACASSLLAIDHARSLLLDDKADLVLAGGVHLAHSEDFFCVFHQLGLLSTQGMSRPLDRRADGLLIGEGVGIVALKRAADAERQGDRVYACLLGTGSSSDGRGTSVMRPSVHGQRLALEAAWRASGCDPADLQLLEAHATGTQIGDAVELETVGDFFGPARGSRATIGSVKSMIGHALPAAGIAGFIKTALALYHQVLPPTLHCEEPRAELEATRFLPRGQAQAWEGRFKLAAVNAFGFGGINAHAVLGSVPRNAARIASRAPRARERQMFPEVARYAQADLAALLAALHDDRRGGDGCFRAAIVEPSVERRAQAARAAESGRSVHGRNGMFVSAAGLIERGGQIAFVFPGLDAGTPPRAAQLERWLAKSIDERPPQVVDLEAHGRAVTSVNRLVLRALERLGIEPAQLAGHSIGEWSAIEAAGIADANELSQIARALEPGSVGDRDVCFVSVGCSAQRLSELLGAHPSAAISHDNCPHQSVLACPASAAPELTALLCAHGVLAQRLPFGSGVHSRFFAPHLERQLAQIEHLQLRASARAVYSATTAAPYPTSAAEIRQLIARHMLEPVRFREMIERMYRDGARVFVQVGTGPLTNFIADTLRGRAHVALAAHGRERSDLEQLAYAACGLWVEGARVDWCAIDDGVSAVASSRARKLQLGAPLVRLSGFELRGVTAEVHDVPGPAPADGLSALLQSNFARMAEVQCELESAVRSRTPYAAGVREVEHELSVDNYPELRDHSFYRQPENWPDLRDRAPIVPMTGLIELLTLGIAHERQVVALYEVWAKRWLEVAPAKRVRIKHTPRADGSVHAEIDDYASARVEFGSRPERAPGYLPFRLTAARPVPIDAEQLYGERFMFHGPAYRGVHALHEIGSDGITGELVAGAALGSLLDAAGQLLGLWLMLTQSRDRFALPHRIGSIKYHGSAPAPGERCACSVRITALEAERLVGDIRIGNAAGLWVEIESWQDYRFVTDDALLQLSRWPERTLLCAIDGRAATIQHARYRSQKTYEMLLGHYTAVRERSALSVHDPRRRWNALLERIAVKDAVRAELRRGGVDACFPIELETVEIGPGRYRVTHGGQRFQVGVVSGEHEVRAWLDAGANERAHHEL